MLKYFKDLKTIYHQLKTRSTSMQHRLLLYFMSIIAVIICVFLLICAVTDIFSFSKHHLNQGLSMTLDNSASKITKQFDDINAYGIKLSNQISTEIEYILKKNNNSFYDLNNSKNEIEKLEQAIYNPLNQTMELSECSGAYVILDITTNTNLDNSAFSRSGLYLRRTSVNDCNSVNSGTALFRGMKEVARKNKIEMHNRWNMEFNTEKFPFYNEFKANNPLRAANSYLWTKKQSLTDTWEKAMFLIVPIVGSRGEFYGICGVEISELYFLLAYPSSESEFGTIVTLLTPKNSDSINLYEGLCGAEKRGKFTGDVLHILKEDYFNYYSFNEKKYLGLSRDIFLSASNLDDTNWAVTVLLPEPSFYKYSMKRKMTFVSMFIILLIIMIIMSVFLSKRYVKPIIQRLQAIQKGNLNDECKTGMSEIDELFNYLQLQKESFENEKYSIPEGIQEIFDNFIERTKTLTNAEYNILKYYIDGYQIMEIPDLAFISISTVRRHNRSIYEKLEVASKDELMLYIDLLRRWGRLDEINRNN
ncbi:MAG: helix-turn-helix transcriptional regulator [Lachnospirales bacterium]